MNKKIHELAVFIEFLVGSGLAIFFHMVLKNEVAAYLVFALGILLSLVTYLIREDIEKSKVHLADQFRHVHEIPLALAQISDSECKAKADELVAATLKSISLLQEGYIPLDEMEFYHEGARLSNQSTRQIKAVSPLTSGWFNRGALVNFYQANLRALDRGVQITRIFVTSRDGLLDTDVQKVLLAHQQDDIDVRLAFREELPPTIDISGRDTNSSFDFAVYDDRSVTDVYSQPGKYYGRKCGQAAEIAKYLHLYELIEHCAHEVMVEDDRVVPVFQAAIG
ncbi:MAG: hypothetical protein HXX17_08835 [Geobacteraceae bacterium]|nr:hypothetical protein [Geobacteraceae bacterium]